MARTFGRHPGSNFPTDLLIRITENRVLPDAQRGKLALPNDYAVVAIGEDTEWDGLPKDREVTNEVGAILGNFRLYSACRRQSEKVFHSLFRILMAGVRAEKSCFRLSRHSAVRLTAEAVGELARGLWAGVSQHVNCSSDPLANRPLSVSCRMIRATCEIDLV